MRDQLGRAGLQAVHETCACGGRYVGAGVSFGNTASSSRLSAIAFGTPVVANASSGFS